ncbi:hypothetical protein BGZ96_012303 [Linnemannia gamsii]|uniref:Uncharacterized protein n=1 Tax=Linnemannia gamsii TaxID=64522 RepID=A0ABQ7KBM9_9FUNG|nr:hypothetical protein BGZ96_012303 [Linnemannia gamsii]
MVDCNQYLEHEEKFKGLANIRFSFNNHPQVHGYDSQEMTPEQEAVEQEKQKEREVCLTSMAAFVQEHVRIHRKVLRTANCGDSYLWHYSDQRKSNDYQLRLLKLLPPLHNPSFLEEESMQQFCMNPDDTAFDFVERINTNDISIDREDLLPALSCHLCRCRALKFTIERQKDDLSRWAVKEKQEYDRQLNNGQVPTKPLVPLKSARLQFCTTGYGPQINSFQRFGDTLALDCYGQFPTNNYDDRIDEPVVCGWQWSLPRLDRLTILTYTAPLILYPDTLSRCPALEYLCLEDSITSLQHTDNIPSWSPTNFPHLQTLALKCTPARVFHPDTLHNTSDLETLCISIDHVGERHLIPPNQELGHLFGQDN